MNSLDGHFIAEHWHMVPGLNSVFKIKEVSRTNTVLELY